MKISCTQENLYRGLQVTSHIAGKESGLPILTNVLLKAEGGLITLCSTNLEIGIQCRVRGKAEHDGSVALDARITSEYVSLLPKDRIDIEVSAESVASVQCGTFSTKMKGVVADDFPIIPTIEKKEQTVVKIADIKRAIQNVLFAVKYDESRPELSGVYMAIQEANTLVLAGTDAYRLAELTVPVTKNFAGTKEVIVPLRTLQELARILPDVSETVEIYIHDNQILFCTDEIDLISKTIAGQYPDYKQIIPQNHNTKAVIDIQELTKAVKSSSIFSRAGLNDVTLQFASVSEGKGSLTISASNTTVGEHTVVIPVKMEGGENSVVLNHRYLLDGLSRMQGDQISFAAIDSNSPCVIKSLEDESYLYLVMPIRQ